jgi:hypothetical protein
MTDKNKIVDQLQHLSIPIESLHLDPANARKHGDRNRLAIRSSLARFGQRKPIVVRKDGMVVEAGNGTLEAAIELGWDQIATAPQSSPSGIIKPSVRPSARSSQRRKISRLWVGLTTSCNLCSRQSGHRQRLMILSSATPSKRASLKM